MGHSFSLEKNQWGDRGKLGVFHEWISFSLVGNKWGRCIPSGPTTNRAGRESKRQRPALKEPLILSGKIHAWSDTRHYICIMVSTPIGNPRRELSSQETLSVFECQGAPADGLQNRKGSMLLLLANAGDSSWLDLFSPCTNKHVPPKQIKPRGMTFSYLNCSHVFVSRLMLWAVFLQSRKREALKQFLPWGVCSRPKITFHDPNKLQGHKPNYIFLRKKDWIII